MATNMTALRIGNRDARRLWLASHGLAATPTGPLDVLGTIRRLGFVQLDSIQIVARAHHHILWSRNQNYRERKLDQLLAKDRAVFEHFTHDASVLPVEFYPVWTRQFRRHRERFQSKGWYKAAMDPDLRARLKARIAAEGPLCTSAFTSGETGPRAMWERPPHKVALDYMWHVGELATAHRRNFTKYYDLTERVIPKVYRDERLGDEEQIDRLCHSALDRLGFGSQGDIRRFWEATEVREVADWVARTPDLVEVEVEGADRSVTRALASPDIEARLAEAPAPTTRLRILNPFDPAVRDRNRLQRLFGFDYRNEIFVPAAQRIWGYYVFPLLEGDRFVGRIEAKADRKRGTLCVSQLWAEPRVRWTPARQAKLEAELERFARLAECTQVDWACAPCPA